MQRVNEVIPPLAGTKTDGQIVGDIMNRMGNAGRTHKHDLRHESDPRNNLPTAAPRPDLENKTAREVWATLMAQANIQHTGTFTDPE